MFFCLGQLPFVSAAVIYVDSAATGTASGLSWTDAYPRLQGALQGASAGDQIWVAKGTYFATYTTHRDSSLNPPDGVDLYGGFAGNESSLSQRDFNQNITILSAELGAAGVHSDNARNVIWVQAANGIEARIDGFHMVGGHGDNTSGGAFYAHKSTVIFANCVFEDNYAEYGGAICSSYDNRLTFIDCEFVNNWALWGGAYQCYGIHEDRIIHCVFKMNSAVYQGGAISITDMSNLSLESCKIYNNSSPQGGALTIGRTGRLNCMNVIFDGNQSTMDNGGAIYADDSSEVLLYNSVFTQNAAMGEGGGIYTTAKADVSIFNSIIWGNAATGFEANVGGIDSACTIQYSLLEDPFSGVGNILGNPQFEDIDGADNIPGNWDDRLSLLSTSPGINSGNLGVAFRDKWDLNMNADTLEVYPEDVARQLRVSGISIDMGAYEFDTSLQVQPQNGRAMWVEGPFPNPSVNGFELEIGLEKAMTITFELYDLRGRMLHSFGNKRLPRGKTYLQLPQARLSRGLYLLRLSSENFVSDRRLLIR